MKPILGKRLLFHAVFLITAIAVAVGGEPANDSRFVFDGQPVHPMFVLPLFGDLGGEQPMVAAVDLEGSAQRVKNDAKLTTANGTVRAQDGEGFVAYRHIGATPGGLHVLVVMVSGGGSGVFEDVIWVKLVHDQVWDSGRRRDRTMLVKAGQFTLGDRDDGDVRLDGAKLLIGKSQYREHATTIAIE